MSKTWVDSSELGCEVGFVCGRCGWDHPTGTLCADLAAEAPTAIVAAQDPCSTCAARPCEGGPYASYGDYNAQQR